MLQKLINQNINIMKKFFILKLLFIEILITFYFNGIILAKNININNTYLPKINSVSYILMDYNSGKILAEKNSNMRRDPASLTKIMTSYVIGQYIKSGKIHNNDIVHIKKDAWAYGNNIFKGSSLMFLKPGDHVSVSELVHGIILQSGNDACVAIADHIAGDEKSFVSLMNFYVKKLGLKNTHFKNAHGLTAKGQYSSAKDMAILSRALIADIPEEYIIYKEKEFTFNNIHQTNRNKLLWDKSLNVDGIKTGHTKAAGYNLVSSISKNNMRLISSVLGSRSEKERDMESKSLLNWGLNFFKTFTILKAEKKITSQLIFFGKQNYVNLGVNKDISLTIPNEQIKYLKINYSINNKLLFAPLYKGQIVGQIFIKINKNIITQEPLVVLNNIDKGSILTYIIDYIKIFLHRLFN